MAHGGRDWIGSILGFAVFLGGVALMVETFNLAYQMFHVPADHALGLTAGKNLQLNQVGSSVASILIRILLLLVMGFVGSLVANRGILLVSHCRPHFFRNPSPPEA